MPRCRRAVLYTFLGFVAAFACSRGPFHRTVFAQSAEPGAHADILSPVEEKLGTAKFFAVADGVKIQLDVIQQVPGMHTVRILSVGKCEGPDFTSRPDRPSILTRKNTHQPTPAGRPRATFPT